MLRFEGGLYFANTGYFDYSVQKVISRKPNIKFLIIDGVSMNQMDATGEEMIRELYQRMSDSIHSGNAAACLQSIYQIPIYPPFYPG